MGASQILESAEDLSYIVLTGGRSSRFGSDKQLAMLAGISLFDRIISDIPVGHKIFVSGFSPTNQIREIKVISDEIKNMGPVAGLAQTIKFIDSKFVAVIATDIPFGPRVIRSLIPIITEAGDGFVPIDSEGVLQSLCAIYRTSKLRSLLLGLQSVQNMSMKSILQQLQIKAIQLPADIVKYLTDIDTQSSLYLANELFTNEKPE